MTLPRVGSGRAPGARGLAGERADSAAVRHALAGASFAFAAANLAVIAFLDLLRLRHYEWLIGGPAPFDAFGSGPVMLWLHVAFGLAIAGFLTTGRALLRNRPRLLAAGLAMTAIGLLGPVTVAGAVV